MTTKTAFLFPTQDHLGACRKFYESVNGQASFEQARHWQSDIYSAEVHCSAGAVLEKAGLAMMHMSGGMVEGASADLILLQTLAWPANPCIPGFIIMASTSKLEEQNVMVTFYTDLIIQNAVSDQGDKDILTAALSQVCNRYGQNIDEYQSFLAGRGMLGGCAAECGILYFFEESDAVLLGDIIQAVLKAYRQIIDSKALLKPAETDFTAMRDSRKKIVEWILTEDYGVKVARQNNIPIEVMEAYGFPPPEHS